MSRRAGRVFFGRRAPVQLGIAAGLAAVLAIGGAMAQARVPAGEEFIRALERSGVEPAPAAPPRARGDGPFERLVIRGATLIDGTGAPAYGPVDIVIEGARIREVRNVGVPGEPIDPEGRPAPGDREIDARDAFVLPGFVDAHAHIPVGLPEDYAFKLWLGHGITTIREPGTHKGLGRVLEARRRSAAGEIAAPRILAYPLFPSAYFPGAAIDTVDQARDWIEAVAERGADGIKMRGNRAAIAEAAIAAAEAAGLKVAYHVAQNVVAETDIAALAALGLDSLEHWYGIPEALLAEDTVQRFPPGYNYSDELARFRAAGRLWAQTVEPGSERWTALIDALAGAGVALVPTLTVYDANRDLMRARMAEWHADYSLPALLDGFAPDPRRHGAYHWEWTSRDEAAWRGNFRRWMVFLDDFKDAGGHVAAGSDAGSIYTVYGFGLIRELELLLEAGFTPLEVVRSATRDGARLLGRDGELGTVAPGKRADLVIVGEDPLADFKVLYATGALSRSPERGLYRTPGIRWTIKDGTVFDAQALLADVRAMVAGEKGS